MIDTQMILSFLEKDYIHNNASNYYDQRNNNRTVAEIATYLESKFHVISVFLEVHKDDIMLFIAKEKFHAGLHPEDAESSDFAIANYIKGLWTDYINKREHQMITGFQSKRSRITKTATFYDTGDYSDSMTIKCNNALSQRNYENIDYSEPNTIAGW